MTVRQIRSIGYLGGISNEKENESPESVEFLNLQKEKIVFKYQKR